MVQKSLTRRHFVHSCARIGAVAPTILALNSSSAQDGEKPALLGGEKAVRDSAPEWPQIQEPDEEKFMETFRSRGWCRLGNKVVDEFEEKWSTSLKVNHAVATVNGTSSLYAALFALGVGPGDEVIVPSYTFVASVNAILQQFALPVFADTDRKTFQLDTTTLEERITEHTRCIMPVHLGGSMANMDEVLNIAKSIIFLWLRMPASLICRVAGREPVGWEISGTSVFRKPRSCPAVRAAPGHQQ